MWRTCLSFKEHACSMFKTYLALILTNSWRHRTWTRWSRRRWCRSHPLRIGGARCRPPRTVIAVTPTQILKQQIINNNNNVLNYKRIEKCSSLIKHNIQNYEKRWIHLNREGLSGRIPATAPLKGRNGLVRTASLVLQSNLALRDSGAWKYSIAHNFIIRKTLY